MRGAAVDRHHAGLAPAEGPWNTRSRPLLPAGAPQATVALLFSQHTGAEHLPPPPPTRRTTPEFLSVDPMLGSTHQPYAYAGGDPLNESDPLGLKGTYCIKTYKETTPGYSSHYFQGTKYGPPNGKCGQGQFLSWLSYQTQTAINYFETAAAQQQASLSEAPATSQATSPARSSSPPSSPPQPSGVAQGFQSASDAFGTLAVGADVANVAELGSGLLPAESVSYPATVVLNGLATGTGCVANILGDGSIDNCFAGIALFVGTSGFASYSAIHALSAAAGDAVTVYNDVTSYLPWSW